MPLTPKPSILDIKPYKGGLSTSSATRTIKLSSNETPLGPSPKAMEAYAREAEKLHRYPDGGATLLRQTIEEIYGYDRHRIVCGAGSDEIISLLCLAYAGPGDEIVHTEHGFLMYAISAKTVGATPVVAKESHLKTDVDAILDVITDRTKIVFVANPNNPTGSYISIDELKRLRNNLRDDILLVIDGAYAEYVERDDYNNGASIVDVTDNTVMTRTFSKIHGLAALRLGWAYCPEPIADILNRVRGPFNVSSPALIAGVEALEDEMHMRKAIEHNNHWLPVFDKELTAIGLTCHESVCNFVLVSFPDNNKTSHQADEYLMQQGIIGRRVDNYGLPNSLRFTIGVEEENQLLIKYLTEFMNA